MSRTPIRLLPISAKQKNDRALIRQMAMLTDCGMRMDIMTRDAGI